MLPDQTPPEARRIDLNTVTSQDGYSVNPIDVKREHARQYIAYAIVGYLGFIVRAAFASYWCIDRSADQGAVEELIKFISALIAPVIGIVGAATGFYFGAAATAANQNRPD